MSKLNTIKNKLILLSTLILIIPLLTTGLLSYQKSSRSLDELGKANLKNSVEMTIRMIGIIDEQVKNGNITLEEAQEQVKTYVLDKRKADGTRDINPFINIGENGYMFILDDQGNQLAHPTLEGESSWETKDPNGIKSTQKIIKKAQTGGGFTYFSWSLTNDGKQIEPKVAYSRKDPFWGWNIVAGTYMRDFNAPAKGLLHYIGIIIGVSVVLGILIIWLFARRISNPILLVAARMKLLSTGNLAHPPLKVKAHDEVGQLGKSMNQMQGDLKTMINEVAVASETITAQSKEFSQAASEVKEGSDQVASTMQELASGSETQASHAASLNENMDTFNNKIQEADLTGEAVLQSAEDIVFLADQGKAQMNQSVTQMDNVHEKVRVAVEHVQGLDEQTSEIEHLVQVIKEVAEQTNLLSLNAAIEAARAGESGKGFAVVASEVRKLSEQVAQSVTEITLVVERISHRSDLAVNSLNTSFGEVEKGKEQIELTGETFTTIHVSMQQLAGQVSGISSALKDLRKNGVKINTSIEEIAAVAEESAAGVEQVAASAQQTNASMEEVSHGAAALANVADDLHQQIRQFTVK